jgi:hypothetical protein
MKWQASMQELLSDVPESLLQTAPDVHLQLWKETPPQASTIFVGEELEARDIVMFLKDKKNGHLVQKAKDHFSEDIEMTSGWLTDAETYFENPCLKAPTHREVIAFSDKEKKNEIREKLYRFLDGVQGPSLPDAAIAIFEELFMNATIDAPKEAQRRGQKISSSECQMIFERHSKKIAISCRDPYGALDVQKFLDRMAEVYEKGAGDAINMTQPGGAGLGCVILFENCVQLIVGCHEGKWSKVTCILPLGCSQRQRAEMKKSLHRIEIPS